jgi:hypothetical protein
LLILVITVIALSNDIGPSPHEHPPRSSMTPALQMTRRTSW